MRALHTAATGMMAQELNVQVISNNIANMRTTGYKRQRAEFQDLLYEHVKRIGTQTSTQGNIQPVGIDLGGGVKTVGTPRLMTQGGIAPTGTVTYTYFTSSDCSGNAFVNQITTPSMTKRYAVVLPVGGLNPGPWAATRRSRRPAKQAGRARPSSCGPSSRR